MIELKPGQTAPLSDILVEELVCPVDRANLRLEDDHLICTRCGRLYPIVSGVPDMLVEESI